MSAALRPPRSSACSPAIVVPPGLATISLRAPADNPLSSNILAEPYTVCAASRLATSRGNPMRTPPSLRASIRTATYAGPLPESPVTTSSNFSGTAIALPTAFSKRSINCTSSAVACGPAAYAEALAPTRHGVVSMTPLVRRSLPTPFASCSSVIPAAMDTTRCLACSAGLMSARTSLMCCGLTARTTTSLRSTMSRLPALVQARVSCVKAARAAGRGSLALRRSAATRPAFTQPFARADAILPAPRKPIAAPSAAMMRRSVGKDISYAMPRPRARNPASRGSENPGFWKETEILERSMTAPDWLTLRHGALKLGSDGGTWYVLLDGQPQYALIPVPVAGKFGCFIKQTNNGQRIDGGGSHATAADAVRGGLDDLRKTLGW